MTMLMRGLSTFLLLICSNIFMTFAWYYHVGKRDVWPLWTAIGLSWLIALPEYALQVPANRIGHTGAGGPFTLPQLKIIQEAVTLLIFTGFAIFVAHEKPRSNDYVAMFLIFLAVLVAFAGRKG